MSNQYHSTEKKGQNTVEPAMELLRLLRVQMAETLTPKQYQVFTLHFVDGVPQKVIAAELGLSRPEVSRLYRAALEHLRKVWNEENVRSE